MKEPTNLGASSLFASLARAAIMAGLYAVSWRIVAGLPPDFVGRRIAPFAFLVFVGSLSIAAYFVTRGAPGWQRLGAALLSGGAASACFLRPDEPAVVAVLGAGFSVGLGGFVGFSGRSKSNPH